MSLDSLPDCIAKCLRDQAESLGCEEDDIQCFCEKEVSGSDGPELSSCVLSECPAEDMLSIGMDLLSFCDDIPASNDDETTSGTRASSRSPSTATDTLSEAETTAPPPAATGEDGSGESNPNQSSDSSQTSASGGLSTGAKAGIGIGAALGVILLLLVAFLLGRRRRRHKDSAPTPVLDSKHHEKRGLEMEGEKWVPELDAQKNQIPAELECPSTR